MVLICSPFSESKNLGAAYNETFRLIGDNDWLCLVDTDTCFLTPDCGVILNEYARRFPDAGILTCYTNRLSPLSRKQMLNGAISEESDMRVHLRLAEERKSYLHSVSIIDRDISGCLMMISKRTWNRFPFPEDKLCLGVDTAYNRTIRKAGLQILRMNGIYIWHTYRLLTGIHDKQHLK